MEELDEEDLPINILDKIPVDGPVIFIAKNDPFFGKGEDFQSQKHNSPTWLTITGIANESVFCTGDQHHIFLEGIENTGQIIDNTPIFELIFGS